MNAFSIRNARAMIMANGSMAWNGDVYHNGQMVGRVSNDGDGGCCDWYWISPALERAFAALASTRYPEDIEAADRYVGDLWDTAITTQE